MNITNAKKIPLDELLARLGHHPKDSKKKGNELWYISPFRNENEPSFKINLAKNIWYDFGEGKGGNIIDFVMAYDRTNFVGALRILNKLENIEMKPANDNMKATIKNTESDIKLIEVKPLFHFALKNYLKQRGINFKIAEKYLKEVRYSVDDKEYFALGFGSRSGGWELRNSHFKNSIGTKDITVIEQPENRQGSQVAVFEGFMDFLSYACMVNEKFSHDVIVLNSAALKERAVEFIIAQGYKDIHTNFDNDPTGEKVLGYFREMLKDRNIRTYNYLYSSFTDLNEYWAEKVKQLNEKNNQRG